jgi:uncharacterized delta-60 repeat protein
MSFRQARPLLLLLCLPLWLTACGGGGGGDEPGNNTPSPLPPGTIGPAGGTVTGPAGAQVQVPAGALTQNTTIVISQTTEGAPALPAGYVGVGPMFAFTPHGTSFASLATVTIPYDAAQVPTGETPVMLKTNAAQTGWEPVPGVTLNNGVASANISGFSWILMSRFPPPDPLDPNGEPQRYYEFGGWNLGGEYRVVDGNFDDLEAVQPGVAPGILQESAEFGLLSFSPPGGDQIASGHVFSSADGKVYFAGAEAPSGDLLNRDPDATYFGGKTGLRQFQSYRKNAANATMEIVITAATLRVADFNSGGPRLQGCPWSGAAENTVEDCNDVLSAHLEMKVQTIAGTGPDSFLEREVYSHLKGAVMLEHLGSSGTEFQAFESLESGRTPANGAISRYRSLFDREMFDVVTSNGLTEARLRQPLRVQIDLSRIPVCTDPDDPNDPNDSFDCPEFTVQTNVDAWAHNRRSSETYASAFLRDPLNLGGDVEVITTGLTPTNRPYLGRTPAIDDIELQCSSGEHPDAGTLEFNTDQLRLMEFGAIPERLYVTRTGGSTGELSARIRVHDGSAIEGTHFASVAAIVTFRDGDSVPKAISIPTINNNTSHGNVEFSLELQATPACARLGSQTTVEVTLVDDEARAVINPELSGTLDTSFGGDGMVDTGNFGGPGTDMIQQPDGKFVIVGGTFTDFIAARFNPDGSLDTGFGGTGMVSTDVAGTTRLEGAMAVAIQPDDKLVVAGYSVLANNSRVVTLVRYNPDGSVDTSFGSSGYVQQAALEGVASAVAIQADGKILVAGATPVDNNVLDYADALVARFNADGSLDATFGDAGSKVFALTSGTDDLRNLVLLADGSMFVSGESGTLDPANRGGIAKLTASGQLDAAFGSNGTWSIPGAHLGYGLAVQDDGKLLVAGGTVGYPSNFSLMRLNADGSADASFGNAGAITANLSGATSGIGDYALAVRVQSNGLIYVAGVSGSINQNFAVARFTSAGALDTTFSGDGFTLIDFSGQGDAAENLVLQSDGRIVLGGYATPTSVSGFGLARVHP